MCVRVRACVRVCENTLAGKRGLTGERLWQGSRTWGRSAWGGMDGLRKEAGAGKGLNAENHINLARDSRQVSGPRQERGHSRWRSLVGKGFCLRMKACALMEVVAEGGHLLEKREVAEGAQSRDGMRSGQEGIS